MSNFYEITMHTYKIFLLIGVIVYFIIFRGRIEIGRKWNFVLIMKFILGYWGFLHVLYLFTPDLEMNKTKALGNYLLNIFLFLILLCYTFWLMLSVINYLKYYKTMKVFKFISIGITSVFAIILLFKTFDFLDNETTPINLIIVLISFGLVYTLFKIINFDYKTLALETKNTEFELYKKL